jgi:mannose-6-phosphate isomerase
VSSLYPLRLTPSWREKIWGSANLEPLFGAGNAPPGPSAVPASGGPAAAPRIGEVWFTFEENTIANGPLAGQTLAALIERYGPDLMGTGFRPMGLQRRSADPAAATAEASSGIYFPLLVKFLFTSDKLSVQVHPDDAYALRHEDGPGKTEMWYVLRADSGAAVALGLDRALTREELRQAAVSGEIEQYLNWVPVNRGDVVFSPPGTLHSIGAGLALCEIQQNSDLTYRFYDFGRLGDDGRPRPLHIDRAVEVTCLDEYDWLQTPSPFCREVGGAEPLEGETLVVCDYFAVERIRRASPLRYDPEPARFHVLVFLEGRGTLGDQPYRPGDVYLIPAAAEAFEWRPAERTLALRGYVPGD